MARNRETNVVGERLIPLVPVVVVTLATALAFARVFDGPGTTPRIVLVALASLGLAIAVERRSLLLATAVSAVGLLVAIGIAIFPGTTLYGFPTVETLGAIGRALARVGEQARTEIAPTPPTGPLLLAAVTAVWTAVFSAHALALRAGSPLLALVPPVALVAFADHVLDDDARLALAILFLAGGLGVVFADGLRRVREWGPVWSGTARARRHRLPEHPAGGAVRIAVTAVLVAAFLPGILPGFGSSALVDLSEATGGGDGIGLDPLVSVAAQLQRDEVVPVLQVDSDRGSYWRMVALDVFDGTTWTTDDLQLQEAPEASSGVPLPGSLLDPDALPAERRVTQVFTVLNDIRFPWIPMAATAVELDLPASSFRYDAVAGVAALPEGLQAGTAYGVVSDVRFPEFEELDRIAFTTPAPRSPYVQLPDDLPDEIREIAREWTQDEPTAFRKILAIQETLRTFTYDATVAPRDSQDALVRFLTEERRGFCQQFASAMAVLVRSLGYPARVAVGYRQGEERADGQYRVTTDDAHSWVEVQFPTVGWVLFEPTPTRPHPVAETSTFLAPTPACRAAPENCPGRGGGGGGGGTQVAGDPLFEVRDPQQRVRGEGPTDPTLASPLPDGQQPGGIPIGVFLRVVTALALLFVALMPLAKLAIRRWRLGRAHEPRELIIATYRVFDDRAADVGLARQDGETPREYRRRLAETVRFSDGDLERLTSLAVRAAYALDEPSATDAAAARAAARRAIRDVRRDAGLLRVVTGIYRPGT